MERIRVSGYNKVKVVDNSGESGIMNLLPGIDDLVIDVNKFTQYALNPEKEPNKAKAFKEALGYDLSNADKLIKNIKDNVHNFDAVKKGHTEYGEKYEVLMTLIGENGKKANVKTAWIVDDNTGKTRLVSPYVTKKKFKEE